MRFTIHFHLLAACLMWAAPLLLSGAGAEDQQAYIEQWKSEAIRQMVEHRIPASITLAQGILESGSGKSELSRKSNNHFGIKCHKGWVGGRTYYDDDKKGECFRVYDDPKDSYQDHSLFLKRDRYVPLFALRIDDYKGWARGLKRCGYATSPTYAKALIELIERHQLHRFDDEGIQWIKRGGMPEKEGQPNQPTTESTGGDTPGQDMTVATPRASGFSQNDVAWIQGRKGETLKSLAQQFQVSTWQLRKYNDLDGAQGSTVLQTDCKLYTQPKRRRGVRNWHVVEEGETLRSISVLEAVKLKVLMQRTSKSADQALPVGYKVPLRFPARDDGTLPWYARIGDRG